MSVYEKLDFPPYEFREYPKWIKLADGTEKLVASQREELAVLSTVPDAAKNDPVLEEKNRLAEQVAAQAEEMAAMKTQLAELLAKTDKAPDKAPESPPDPPKPAPVVAKK